MGDRPHWASLFAIIVTIFEPIVPAKEGGHEVKFNHAGWPAEPPPEELASVNYTWGRVVGRLKKHVETGDAVPYFP